MKHDGQKAKPQSNQIAVFASEYYRRVVIEVCGIQFSADCAQATRLAANQVANALGAPLTFEKPPKG